jgi:hypothetical protein
MRSRFIVAQNDSNYREVVPGEIFEPGRTFRLNQVTGISTVLMTEEEREQAQPLQAILEETLAVLFQAGDTVELRIPAPKERRIGVVSGYFSDITALAKAAQAWDGRAEAIYVALNPVNAALLARSVNHVTTNAKTTTQDSDVRLRRWLLIDLDPLRPSGISSSEAEHQAALARATEIKLALASVGWPDPILADSGNGAHLLYRVDLPNDRASKDLFDRVLRALSFRFGDSVVGVDETVGNAARISKLYGTLVAKGDNTPDRPHRRSQLFEVPANPEAVSSEALEALAAAVPTSENRPYSSRATSPKPFDLDTWIADHGLNVVGPDEWKGGRKWIFHCCPWISAHTNRSAYIVQLADGAIAAGCHHDSCRDKDWHALRDLVEPGWRDDHDAVQTHSHVDRSNGRDVVGAENSNAHPDAQVAMNQQPSDMNADGLPDITVNNRQLRETSDEVIGALVEANQPPELFVRGGALVRVRVNEKGRPIIQAMLAAALRGRIARCTNCMRESKSGQHDVSPPEDVVNDILSLGVWPFPALEGIVEIPILRPDGTLLSETGYDAETRVIYYPSEGFRYPPIAAAPTQQEAIEAAKAVFDLVVDFPFVDDASRANVGAALLSPVVRTAFGTAPLALIDAPQPGTGKDLLADVIAVVGTGRATPVMSEVSSDDEWRKQITTVLHEGATFIVIGNVDHPLCSASLARALTATSWKDRLLGHSQSVEVPNRATWIATGNNIRLGGDLPRRCYWIRMDAKMSRPWLREGFKYPQLLAWVGEHRGEVVAHLLTMARAWYCAGRPDAGIKPLGSFEDWTRVIAGILNYAGVPGFLGNLDEMYKQSDEETQQWEFFLLELWRHYGEKEFSIAQLTADLKSKVELRESLPDDLAAAAESLTEDEKSKNKSGFRQKLGKALAKRADVRYGEANLHLVKTGTDSRGGRSKWRVEKDAPTAKPADLQISQISVGQSGENLSTPGRDEANGESEAHPLMAEKNLQNLQNLQPAKSNGKMRLTSALGEAEESAQQEQVVFEEGEV